MKSLTFALLCVGMVAAASAQTLQGSTTFKADSIPVTSATRIVVPYANGFYAITGLGNDNLVERYNVNGVVVASTIYDNPQAGSERAAVAGIDTAGNLYLAMVGDSNLGDTTWYVKFDATATVQWERNITGLTPTRLLVTPGGLGILVGETATDNQIRRVAYGANGNLIYDNIATGRVFDAVLGLDNSAWFVGRSSTNLPRVWRYNGVTGTLIDSWTDGFGFSSSRFTTAAIDPNGTFYAAGLLTDDGTVSTAKVGILRFTNVFNLFKPVNQPYVPNRLRIDANNLYLECAKGFVPAVNDRTYSIPKSNPNTTLAFMDALNANSFRGTQIDVIGDRVYTWVGNTLRITTKGFAAVNTTGNLMKTVQGVARGTSSGHVIAFGDEGSPSRGRIRRINQDGSAGFSVDVAENGRGTFTPYAVTTSTNGELFVVYQRNFGSDTQVSRVNKSGTVVWTTDISGMSPRGIAVDDTGVYVVGSVTVGIVSQPIVRKLNRTTGAAEWSKLLSFSGNTTGSGDAIVATDDGHVVVGGRIASRTFWKLASSTGNVVWDLQTSENNTVFQLFLTPGNNILSMGGTRFDRISNAGDLLWSNTSEGLGKMAYQPGLDYFWVTGTSVDGATMKQYTVSAGLLQFTQIFVGTQDNRVPFVNAAGTRVGLMYEEVEGSTRIAVSVNNTTNYANIPGRGVAAHIGQNGETIVFSYEPVPDNNGGNTVKLAMRRFSAALSLQETRIIEPLGLGMNSEAIFMQPGTLGQLFTLGTMERRNEGQTMLVTRWKHELAPIGAADSYTVARNNSLIVQGSGVLGNDSDPNGDAMTVELVSPPQAGTLNLNPNGRFSYTAPSTTGTRTFTYRVVDSTGRKSGNTVVTLNVVN